MIEASDLSAFSAGDLAQTWDGLPTLRGDQADIYDSHAWFAAYLSTEPPGRARRVALLVARESDRIRGILPVYRDRWGTLLGAGSTLRKRYRPVLDSRDPDPEVISSLAAAAARSARQLRLDRLPSRDPATTAFIGALRTDGFSVEVREEATDMIDHGDGSWEGHREAHHSFFRRAGWRQRRVEVLWDLSIEVYGAGREPNALEGHALFESIQSRSWKGSFSPRTTRQRRQLVKGAEANGWARLFVLSFGGYPVAANLMFCMADVAIGFSTAYDESTAITSPGVILQALSREWIFANDKPLVLDHMPGDSPMKDQLVTERPTLVSVEATRRVVAPGAVLALSRSSERVVSAARARIEPRLTHDQALRQRKVARAAPTDPSAARIGQGPMLRPAVTLSDQLHPISPLSLSAELSRYLAVVSRQPTIESMTSAWGTDAEWVAVGSPPKALSRLGPPPGRRVHEIVLVEPVAVDAVLGALRDAGTSVSGDSTIDAEPIVRSSPLPRPKVLGEGKPQ